MELPKNLIEADPEQIDRYCEKMGELFAKGEEGNKTNTVSTSKLRNVFSKISSIRTKYRNLKDKDTKSIERDIILLKPMLAYAKGRDSKLVNFTSEMNKLIDVTINSLKEEKNNQTNQKNKLQSLDNFFVIVEGFIAYHKFHGGKD